MKCAHPKEMAAHWTQPGQKRLTLPVLAYVLGGIILQGTCWPSPQLRWTTLERAHGRFWPAAKSSGPGSVLELAFSNLRWDLNAASFYPVRNRGDRHPARVAVVMRGSFWTFWW